MDSDHRLPRLLTQRPEVSWWWAGAGDDPLAEDLRSNTDKPPRPFFGGLTTRACGVLCGCEFCFAQPGKDSVWCIWKNGVWQASDRGLHGGA